MCSIKSEENIRHSTRVHNANPRGDKHRGASAEHAARRAAHDVEHVEGKLTRMARICSARHGDGRLTIRQKRATRRNARKTSVVVDCRCPKAATHWPWVAGLADPKNPMVGRFAGCCASAVSGHAARDAGRLLRCGISAGLMPASGHFRSSRPPPQVLLCRQWLQ